MSRQEMASDSEVFSGGWNMVSSAVKMISVTGAVNGG